MNKSAVRPLDQRIVVSAPHAYYKSYLVIVCPRATTNTAWEGYRSFENEDNLRKRKQIFSSQHHEQVGGQTARWNCCFNASRLVSVDKHALGWL